MIDLVASHKRHKFDVLARLAFAIHYRDWLSGDQENRRIIMTSDYDAFQDIFFPCKAVKVDGVNDSEEIVFDTTSLLDRNALIPAPPEILQIMRKIENGEMGTWDSRVAPPNEIDNVPETLLGGGTRRRGENGK